MSMVTNTRIAALERSESALEAELRQCRADLAAARALTAQQALDEGLWCIAETAMEGHLQAALRRLAAAVEGDAAIDAALKGE